jgi:RNA polymerase sigma-70 factor (ECF subfamily)
MPETSFSLLQQLCEQPNAASWRRLVELYSPLIHAWLRRYGVPPHDADDLTQEVLGAVVQDVAGFRHDQRRGALRRWLRTITVNRLRADGDRPFLPGPPVTGTPFAEALDQLEDPDSRLSRFWDEQHDRHVLRRLLEMIEPDFEPSTWLAFRRLVVEGEPTAAVASALGMTANAVRIAKSRVLHRLRQELAGLCDDEAIADL